MAIDQAVAQRYRQLRARGIRPLEMQESLDEGVDLLHPRKPLIPQPLSNATSLFLTVLLGYGLPRVMAEGPIPPLMDVDVTCTIADYHPGFPGLESLFTITVYNQSNPGVNNNMINFTYPAGADENGVFYVIPGDGWTPYLNGNHILFDGLLEPGEFAQHQVYSTLTDIGQDFATALALGPPPETFNDVLVDIPIAPPVNPNMSIDSIIVTDPIAGMQAFYTVTNQSSDPNDSLAELFLDVAYNQGVFNVVAPSDWTVVVENDQTYLSSVTAPIPPNGGIAVFVVESYFDVSAVPEPAQAFTPDQRPFDPCNADVANTNYFDLMQGDLNGNGMIDQYDCLIFIDSCMQGPVVRDLTVQSGLADFNDDNQVDMHDLAVMQSLP